MPQAQTKLPSPLSVKPSSVPEIPGIKAEPDLARLLRREVADLLGRNSHYFPGAQPVSFSRRHFDELRNKDYYLCEKSDGIRCLMYFTRDEHNQEIHYLIDRKNDYYWVQNLHFPVAGDETFRSFHVDTLIDGELVMDSVAGSSKKKLRYLVFDCMMLDGKRLVERTLDKRLAYFREHVYNPYKKLCQAFPDEMQYFPYEIEFKNQEFSYGVEMMFRDILPKLPHGNDGLIFTCRVTPYTFGTDQHIIKWKSAEENSIDFRLNLEFPLADTEDLEDDDEDDVAALDYEAMPTFHLSVYKGENTYEKFATMYVTTEEWEELKKMGCPLDEEIVECRMDEEKRWKFMKFRRDKKDANHISTVNSVLDSIVDAVSADDLVREAKSIRTAWKTRNNQPK